MHKPGGYLICTGLDGRVEEFDTFSCAHCCKITVLKTRERAEDAGGYCTCCAKPICTRCDDLGTCTPLEEQLKRSERSYHARRSYQDA